MRSELDRVTDTGPPGPLEGPLPTGLGLVPPLGPPRTIVCSFMSRISVGVMWEGSTMGLGRSWPEPMRLAHCGGRPTKRPSRRSKPVCTRCSKLLGAEMMGFFFFLANILGHRLPAAAASVAGANHGPEESHQGHEAIYLLCPL